MNHSLALAAETIRQRLYEVFSATDSHDAQPPEVANHLLDGLYLDFLLRQPERLRLSYGSNCVRRLWYAHHQPEQAEAKDGYARFKFLQASVTERLLLAQLREALDGFPISVGPPSNGQQLLTLDGVRGHPDQVLYCDGQPLALLEVKDTTEWSWKKWERGRLPDPIWGYRHQAANYLAAFRQAGTALAGVLWPCRVEERSSRGFRFECGWATAAELLPYETEARANFAAIPAMPAPPARPYPSPTTVPCGTDHKAYCPFRDHCWRTT